MRIFGKILTAILLTFFFLSTTPCTADIIYMKLRSDKRPKILFSEFGFSQSGYVSINVSSVSATSPFPLPQPDPSRIGVYLLSHELQDQYDDELATNPSLCHLDSKFVKVLFSPPPQSSFNMSYHVTYPNVYSLYYVNCNLSHVTMHVHAELYNTNDNGTTKDYISPTLPTHPRSLYITFAIIYQCLLVVWILLCLTYWRSFRIIFLLMGLLLVITSVHFIFEAVDQEYMKATGTHHGWDVWCYRFQFMRSELFFMVMVLTGVGWGFWNPILHGLEILALMIVIMIQVGGNLASIKGGETAPYRDSYSGWMALSSVADFCCCFFVLMILIVESVERTHAKTACYLLCVLVGAYGFLTRFILRAVGLFELLPWVLNTAEETCTLVFCMVIFCIFRPFDNTDEKHWLWGKRSLGNDQLPT